MPGKPVATQLAIACASCAKAVDIMHTLDDPVGPQAEFYVETKLDGELPAVLGQLAPEG